MHFNFLIIFMKFTHLHVHSHYSLLDGLPKIPELLDYVKELGMDSVALTDHGVMYGAVEFYKEAKARGIKPIIGCEVYVALEGRLDKRPNIDSKSYHMILLAKNQKGYENLVKLVTSAHLEGFYYKPRIDEEILEKYAEGLIGTSACLNGKIPKMLLANKLEEAEALAKKYVSWFGKDSFYLELQYHKNIPEQQVLNKKIVELSKKTGIPLIATNDSHYLRPEDADAQDILMLINTGADPNDPERLSLKTDDFSMIPPEQMAELFKDTPEAIENTQKIADMCDFNFVLGKAQLPHFEAPNGKTPEEYLTQLCEVGLQKKYGKNITTEIRDRMNYELSVINKTGFAGYILIVQDFVNWALEKRIGRNARGSAAGSLVCYLTDITSVDPIKYDLLFERFLNPERISMPDIDMDFTDRRRDEVLKYVSDKYGKDHVAQIITFGTMAARAVIRDVGRALQYTYSYCDALAKMIPLGMDLSETLEKVSEFRDIYNSDPQGKKLIDLGFKLEGVARHASTHACGVVISAKPLVDSVPLQHPTADDDNIVTQYEMHAIEDLGLLKMDFLGLKNLTIIEDTLARIFVIRNEKIDIENIPFDDKKTYQLLQKALSTSIFQLECLAGDTKVSTTTIKQLYEKRENRKLHSVYLDEGKLHKNEVIDVLKGEVKDLYRLIAENKWSIKASKDHYFMTEDGWKKLEEIKPGDKILVKLNANHSIYNTCSTCRKEICGQREGRSKFCYSCSAKFYRNPSKLESRKKISLAQLKFYENGGKTWNEGLTKETNKILKNNGEKISQALSGKSLEELWGKERADKFKKEHSQRMRGKGNSMFGMPAPHRKGGFRKDLNHYVRSSWEADFARILNLHNIQYQYEPKTFTLVRDNGEILNYTPDFYVPSKNTFYEIKGWMHELDQEKIDLFQKQYPQYSFVLISATRFAEFALKYKKLIAWECPQIPVRQSFSFIKVKEIKYAGKEQTYDIKMKAPGNNFVANGFLVHNSDGMKRYLKDLKPTEFEDIAAMVALYRPGPMQFIPDYIERKHGRQKITYIHPALQSILKNTQGIMIYQEQLMKIAQVIAGFTLGEADVLRKAVGKKIKELLDSQEKKFIDGAIKNGTNKKIAEELWQWILPFAAYGFNKCVTGDTKIISPKTGQLIQIKELVKNKKLLNYTFSLSENFKIKKSKVIEVFSNGKKLVFEVITRSGRKIIATNNHPFYTQYGWKNLESINIKERIAVPRLLPEPTRKVRIADYKIAVLGYMLAEGNLCHPSGFYFYSNSKEEIKDYCNNLEKFENTECSIDHSKSAIAVYAKRKNLKEKSEAVEWISKLGLKYKKATEKFFPDFVFGLSNAQLSLLIAKMFQGDGCINFKNGYAQIFYATSSQNIAEGLQHLLLRFGIISTIHKKKFKYRDELKTGYTININRYDNIQKFIINFKKYLLDNKANALKDIEKNHPILNGNIKNWSARGSKDIIPVAMIKPLMREAVLTGPMSIKEFSKENGFSERLLWNASDKVGYLRETVKIMAHGLNIKKIENLCNSDIFWDEIVSITEKGLQETFDLTIKGTHNFIANNIFVHNSHSVAYATIAYQTAYLKAHYPVEFMASVLTSEKIDVERIAFLIEECKKMDIEVLPPNINESLKNFTVVPNEKKIRFGLLAIKNVGNNIIEAVVEERKNNGPFTSIGDFINRVNSKDLNKKSMEALIKAGAFDAFNERNQLLQNLEKLLEIARENQKNKSNGQIGLFASVATSTNNEIKLAEALPAQLLEKLTWEKELLGLYVSSHPLHSFKKLFETKTTAISSIDKNMVNKKIILGGLIYNVKKIITKTGKPMLFMKLEDLTAKTEIVIFPNLLEAKPECLQENKIVFIAGRVDNRNGEIKIVADDVQEIIVPQES